MAVKFHGVQIHDVKTHSVQIHGVQIHEVQIHGVQIHQRDPNAFNDLFLLVCLNTQGDLGGTPGAPRGQLGCVENKSAEIVIGFFSRRCRLVDVQVSRISHHELHFLNTIAAVYLCLGYTVALLQNAPFVRCTAMSHLFVHEFEQIASDENMSGAPHTPARLLQ